MELLRDIQNNQETNRIYTELRTGFFAYIHVAVSMITEEELEEVYNDSFLALCDNISSGKLQTLTCSLQTYINQIGRNKAISLLRTKDNTTELPDYEIGLPGSSIDMADDDETTVEMQEEVYRIVREFDCDKCKKILFGFYWQHLSLETLAQLTGARSADVVKTEKSRCMKRLREKVMNVFKQKGLI